MKYLIDCIQTYSDKYVVEASSREAALLLLEKAIIEGTCPDPQDLKQIDYEVISDESEDSTIHLRTVDVKEA